METVVVFAGFEGSVEGSMMMAWSVPPRCGSTLRGTGHSGAEVSASVVTACPPESAAGLLPPAGWRLTRAVFDGVWSAGSREGMGLQAGKELGRRASGGSRDQSLENPLCCRGRIQTFRTGDA